MWLVWYEICQNNYFCFFFLSAPGLDSCLFKTHHAVWGQIPVFRCCNTCIYLPSWVFHLQSHPFSLNQSFFFPVLIKKDAICPSFPRTKTAVSLSRLKFVLESGKFHLVRTILLCIKAFWTVISWRYSHVVCLFVWYSLLYVLHYTTFSHLASLLKTALIPFLNTKSFYGCLCICTTVKLLWMLVATHCIMQMQKSTVIVLHTHFNCKYLGTLHHEWNIFTSQHCFFRSPLSSGGDADCFVVPGWTN